MCYMPRRFCKGSKGDDARLQAWLSFGMLYTMVKSRILNYVKGCRELPEVLG